MKKQVKKTVIAGLAALAFVGFMSCESISSPNESTGYTTLLDVEADGISSINETELKSVVVDEPILSENEETLLLHMKDEEKLARDVYNAMYGKWNASIFSRIANAEQKHLNAIMLLIENYTVLETEEGEPGEYENEDFKLLYDQLVVQGTASLEQAYTVGALIEELDIYDLKNYLSQVSNENIIIVFENLMRGSRNHLRAFNKNLVSLGIEYEPQYLDAVTYDEIVNSPMEQGKRYRKRNGGGNGNQGRGGNGQGGNGDGTCNN